MVEFGLGRAAEAVALIERAVAADPADGAALTSLAELRRRSGDSAAARAAALRALERDPAAFLPRKVLCAIAYDQKELAEAIAWGEAAVAAAPEDAEAHFELAKALLADGQFARGWAEMEWRFRIAGSVPPWPAEAAPIVGAAWDGTWLEGRLLLMADQGFGDQVQFARYVPWVAGRCTALVLACSDEIRPFLAPLAPAAEMVTVLHEQAPFDACATLSGLPRLHGTTAANIPPAPYLAADAVRVAAWRARLDGLAPAGFRRVGLVWAGRPDHANDAMRSAPLAALAPLFGVAGIFLVALQKGRAADELAGWAGHASLLDAGPLIARYADTAALIAALDLVISVDTGVAHLAGALGRPVWIMLPYAAEWRWGVAGDTSPWYPSARLFRQAVPRDWAGLAAQVALALAESR